METWRLRDIVIGIVLLLVGGATLLHTLGVIRFDEEMAVMAGIFGLAVLGAVVMLVYLFRPQSIWLMIIAFCLFFLAATIYITYFTGDDTLVGVALFLLTSLAFLLVFLRDRRQWWALLVTWTSLGLAAVVFMDSHSFQSTLFDGLRWTDEMQGLLFLFSVALGFFFVWLADPRRLWWSLMISGLTLAVCAAAGARAFNYSEQLGAVFMFVIAGVVFFLLWLIRNEENGLSWAIYPAAVLLPFSAFLYTVLFWRGHRHLILSIIFIALGLLFIFSSVIFRRRAAEPKAKYRVCTAENEPRFDVTEKSVSETPFVVEEHAGPPESKVTPPGASMTSKPESVPIFAEEEVASPDLVSEKPESESEPEDRNQ
jgi:hypothetical protein